MVLTLIILAVFLISIGGIFFIIKDKLPLVANLDVSQIPEEKIAQTKKNLLEKKVNRQLIEVTARLKTRLDALKIKFKDIYSKTQSKTLDFFRKLGKIFLKSAR